MDRFIPTPFDDCRFIPSEPEFAPQPEIKYTAITLRDTFAIAAITGLATRETDISDIARKAYQLADEMIRARG